MYGLVCGGRRSGMYLINREMNRVSEIKEMTFYELGFKERSASSRMAGE